MDRYKSHIARTDEYGSRCEYCLQSWPCDAVEQATLARAAVRAAHAIVEQADPQLHWGDPTSYAEIKWRLIDELRAVLATDTAQAWLVDSSEL